MTKAKQTHSENLLNSQNALHKDGSQLVTDPCQQKAEERDAKNGIKNAEDLSTLRSWRYVSITCCKEINRKDCEAEAWVSAWGRGAISRKMRSRRQSRPSYAT